MNWQKKMMARVGKLVDATWDRLRMCALCGACQPKTRMQDVAELVEQRALRYFARERNGSQG